MSDDYFFNVKRNRPEELYESALDYFKDETLSSYAKSKSIMRTQRKITLRALEIMELKKNHSLILDAGCGPGFVAIYLNELGHKTIALDIISGFLKFYDIKDLNPILADMCFPPFQPSMFDAIISISALQWIYKDSNTKKKRLDLIGLFKSFYMILKPKGKVVFQFYPKNKTVLDNIGDIIAKNTDFKGNFIIDNPDSPKKRKIYLLLIKE
ncbi:MAG: methyltransferase domain-containing protein [Candidatus Lokiarchaeota archaeon]|nr:methyltransferase domain-containing protein [Candidatus Lokiarchaeota archaeon]